MLACRIMGPATERVVVDFKKAYGLRSRQVHHLASVEDEETLSALFHDIWIMMLTAISNMHRFREQADFVAALDRMKYA